MRLSSLLKLSFVGSLLFTPVMAQETDKVHEEALKVLRSGSAGTNAPVAAPAATRGARGPETPAERNARLKVEAQQRLDERERLQAEKRRQFQEYVRERERMRSGAAPGTVHDQAIKTLREQTAPGATPPATTPAPAATVTPVPATPAPAARPAPAVQPQPSQAPAARPAQPQTSTQPVEDRALEIIRQQQPSSAADTPVRESELAPRTLAPASRSATAETHEKALEVLRQQTGQSSATSTATPAVSTTTTQRSATPSAAAQPAPRQDLKPSPELQRRLDEMNKELNTPPPRSTTKHADTEYTKELEQRALQMMQNQKSATPATATAAPASAPATVTRSSTPAANNAALEAERNREMIRRQEEQLRRQSSGVATTTSGSSATRPAATPPPAARSNVSDPAAEQRAREILRQQQQATSNASAATATPLQSQPPVATTTTVPPTTARSSAPVASTDVQYSQDLENRARQALLARSEAQPDATPAAPQVQAQQAAAASTANISTAPVHNPEVDRVHSRAYETLVQVEAGDSGQARLKTKQERLRALTDLYKSDRMTPAEYHQRRAAILAEKEQQ